MTVDPRLQRIVEAQPLKKLIVELSREQAMTIDPRLTRIVAAQPYPLLFATISGAHLCGFGFPSPPRDGCPNLDVRFAHRGPSPDSDFDLRGAHVLPLEKVVGLEVRDETVEQSFVVPPDPPRSEVISPYIPHPASPPSPHGLVTSPRPSPGLRPPSPTPVGEGQCAEGRALEMDIVTHDVRKFFGLLLKKNGYVLEQLYSPLIVHTTPEHEELKEICSPRSCRRRGNETHSSKESQSLLTSSPTTGSGVITKHHSLAGPEKSKLEDADIAFHESEYQRLRGQLQEAHDASRLPESPSDETRNALNDLLMRARLKSSRSETE